MRSWLSSPAVALVSFISAVVTLAQFTFMAARWIARQSHADDARGRLYNTDVVVSLGALAVIMPLSWSGLAAVAAKNGFPGWQGRRIQLSRTAAVCSVSWSSRC